MAQRFRPAKVFALFVLLCGIGQSQNARPRIAVKTFENPSNYQNSTIGNALTEIITTELGRTGKYRLVERQAADELLKEMDFGTSGAGKTSTFAQKGNLSGAEYFLLGKVTNFGYKEETRQVSVPDYRGQRIDTVYIQEADVRVDFRLVSTKTGEIALSEAGSAHNANTSQRSELQIWFQCLRSQSFNTAEMSNSLIGRTSVQAVKDVVRKLSDLAGEVSSYATAESAASAVEPLSQLEVKILAAIGPAEFVVSAGNKSGLMKGDYLTVYSEVPIKNKKGEVVYRERKEVAKLELTDSDPSGERSKARILQPGAATPQEGDVVKVDLNRARDLRGAAPGLAPSVPSSDAPLAVGPAAGASAAEIIKRGDRYFEDGYYAQALDQYRKAEQLKPNDHGLLSRIVGTHFYLADFLEAETLAGRMIADGSFLGIPSVHGHAFGNCLGGFNLRKGRGWFATQKSDHSFAFTRGTLVHVGLGRDDTWLEFTVREANGKEKRYDLLPLIFVEKAKGDFSRADFVVPEAKRADHAKLLNVLRRLIASSL